MYRDKIVHKMIFHPTTRFSAILEIWASAGIKWFYYVGTYIKEFVHGDMNRTVPNVGSILGKEVDILQLDVGSLKEGEWVEGDDEKMKLGVLAWEKIWFIVMNFQNIPIFNSDYVDNYNLINK